MNYFKILCVLLLLIPMEKASGQDFVLTQTTPIKGDVFIGVDNFGFLYTIKGSVLHKTKDLLDYNYQDILLGPIASVDLTNPLNLILFYQEANTVVVLDNRLNEKQRLKFNEIDPFPALQMALNAGSGRLWLMDIIDQSVWLYEIATNRILAKTPPISGSLLTASCRFNDCLIQTDLTFVRVDNFGNLAWSLASGSYDAMTYNDHYILATKGTNLFLLSYDNGKQRENITTSQLPLNWSENLAKGLQLTQDFLYIYDGIQLYRYTINPSNK